MQWSTSVEQFAPLVRSLWPESTFRRDADQVALDDHPTMAYPTDGPIIGLDGERSTCFTEGGSGFDAVVEFTLGWRRLGPDDVPLILYDEAYSAQVELSEQTTAEELAGAFVS